MNRRLRTRCFAEALGTFFLVLLGCGAVVVSDTTGAFGHVGIALAFGLVVMTMIYSLGDVSGAHFNPAVTLAFWLARVLPGRDVLPYVLAQSAGATLAALLLVWHWPLHSPGVTRFGGAAPAFVIEALISFALMLVILHVSQGERADGGPGHWCGGAAGRAGGRAAHRCFHESGAQHRAGAGGRGAAGLVAVPAGTAAGRRPGCIHLPGIAR